MKIYECSECDRELADWELAADALEEEKPKCPQCGADLVETWNVA